jgi:hypothetical protein
MKNTLTTVLVIGAVIAIGVPLAFYIFYGSGGSDEDSGPPEYELADAYARCIMHGGVYVKPLDIDLLRGQWRGWGDVTMDGPQGSYTGTVTNARSGSLNVFVHQEQGYFFGFFDEMATYPVDEAPPVSERAKQRGLMYFYLCADQQAIEGVSLASAGSQHFPDEYRPLTWERVQGNQEEP